MTHPYTPLKHSWNTLEQILKHPWETLKIPVLQLFDHYIYIPHMRALEGTLPLKMGKTKQRQKIRYQSISYQEED